MMTETPVPKLIMRLAVPTIISMLVTGLYNMADTYFVAQIPDKGTQATAAVGIVFPMMAVIQALGFMFGHGSGNFLSRMLGAGKKKEASEMASTGFALALLTGLLVLALGTVFLRPLTEFLASSDVTEETLDLTMQYARIILIGAPFMMCQFVINNQLRFQGAAMYAMVGLLAGAVINVGLDPLLILGFGSAGRSFGHHFRTGFQFYHTAGRKLQRREYQTAFPEHPYQRVLYRAGAERGISVSGSAGNGSHCHGSAEPCGR